MGCGVKGKCLPYEKHVSSTSIKCEHLKAIYLFHVTLFSLEQKEICSKRMRRLGRE